MPAIDSTTSAGEHSDGDPGKAASEPAPPTVEPSAAREPTASWAGRICKEPLLHFLLLASGLFAIDRWMSGPDAQRDPDVIVVTEARIDSMIQTFVRTWQRPPTAEEVRGLVDDFVKEEVFYREALKMGLDRDDTLIRRRMRQKLEFLAEDFADSTEPSEEQLQALLDANADAYRIDSQFSFRQVYLSPDRRGESIDEDAAELLAQLRAASTTVDVSELGDPTLLPFQCDSLNERQIRNQFGAAFASQLSRLELNRWSDPVDSVYGKHLVQVLEILPGSIPELEDVRRQVRRDWLASRRTESKQQFFEQLLTKYEVRMEPLATSVEESGSTP